MEIIDSSDEKKGKITSTTTHTIYNGTENIENTEDAGEPKLVDIKLENVKKFNDDDEYGFKYDKEKNLLVNTNNTRTESLNTTAKGYLELDLTDYVGKYELSVSADISNAWSGYDVYGHGYVSISNEPDSDMQNGRIIYIYEFRDNTTSTTYKMDLAGGQKYYLNFKYEKRDWCDENTQDEFRITNVTLAKKQEGNLTISGGTIMIEKQGSAGGMWSNSKYFSAIINAGYLKIKGGTITSNIRWTTGINTKSGGTTCLEEQGNIDMSETATRAINVEEIGGLAKISGGNIKAGEGLYTEAYLANAIVTGGNFSSECGTQIYNGGDGSRIIIENVTLNGNSSPIYSKYSNSELIIKKCHLNSTYRALQVEGRTKVYDSTIEGSGIIVCGYIDIEGSKINVDSEGILVTSNCNMNIKNTNIAIAGGSYYNYIIRINGGTTNLTIEDSTLSNEATTGSSQGIIVTNDARGANIDIKGTTNIKSQGSCISLGASSTNTINIESGTLESLKAEAIWANSNATGTINIGTNDGSVNNESLILKSKTWTIVGYRMKLNMYDGKLIGPADKIIAVPINELEVDKDLISSEYQEGEETTGFEVYELGTAEEVVVAILKNTQEGGSAGSEETYPTLKKAVQACKEQVGNEGTQNKQITIKLLKNINQTEQIKIENSQNIKLDLNGHKLYAMTENTIYNEGTLEIIDSIERSEYENNLIGSTGATIIQNAQIKNADGTEETEETVCGNLTIGNGAKIYYTASGYTAFTYKQAIKNEGILNINGAEITITGNYVRAIDNINKVNTTGGKISIKNQYSYGIYNTGSVKSNNLSMEMTGNSSYGIYNDENGNMIITGGQITSNDRSSYVIYHNSIGDAEIREAKIDYGEGTGIYNNNTGTVKINENSQVQGYGTGIENEKTGTIEIRDSTIKSTGSRSIYNYSSGIINVFNAIIQTTDNYRWSCGIYNYSNGTVNIHDGEITAYNYALYNDNNGTINIKKGTITSTNDIAVQNDAGTVNVGEKIAEDNLEKEKPDESNPTIVGKTYGLNNGGTFRFYDGSITGASNQAISGNVSEREIGYQVVRKDNENGTETAKLEKVFIAEIKENNNEDSTVEYSTVKELQAGINNLSEGNEYTIKVTSNFSMDNTEVITIPSKRNITFDINGHTVSSVNESTIENNGNLTIIDSVTESTGGIANGVGGTEKVSKQVIDNRGNATLKIESGKISKGGNYGYGVYNHDTGTVNMNGGTIVTSGQYGHGIYNEGTLEINDGEINTTGERANGIHNLKLINTEGGKITVNGYASYGIYNNSIEDSKIKGAEITVIASYYSCVVYNDKEGKLTIGEETTINASYTAIYNNENAQITIEGGTINAANSYYAVENNKGTVNITGGNLTSSQECIYNTNGTTNIEGGTITSNNSCGVYNRESGKVNITGGTIKSNKTHGINNESGTLTLGKKRQAGEVDGEMQESQSATSQEEPNVDIPVVQGTLYGILNNSTFNFYDGKIIGAVGQSINPNIADKEPEYQIVKTVENDLETATLKKIDIIEVAGETYQTITEAKNAVQELSGENEQKIKLLADAYMCGEENITISDSQNIVLDLNGHSLISSSKNTITNNGTLKITDETDTKLGKILGPAITQIENNGDLIIHGGTYNTTHYVGSAKKLINNNKKLTWEDGNMELNTGNNYGIYNVGDATVEWINGNINANSTSGNQYVIYADSSGDINWENGKITFESTARGSAQYGIYINGTSEINIENITFTMDGSFSTWYSTTQYLIYSNNKNEEKSKITIKNIAGTGDYSSYESYYAIGGNNMILNIEGGYLKKFYRDIDVASSEVNIKEGTFEDTISIMEHTILTVEGGNIGEITNSGQIIINNGTINYLYSSNSSANTIMNGGIITNADVNNRDNTVEISYGSFTLLGGTIESTKGYGVKISYSGEFTIGNNDDYVVHTDAPSVKGSTYGVYKDGGTFNFYDGVIEGGTKAINGEVTKMPEIYQVTYEDEQKKAYLTINSAIEKVVSIGDKYFEKLETAIKYANIEGGTLIIHGDLTIDEQLTIEGTQPVIINLNGHNLKGEISSALFMNKGDLTIIDEITDDEGNVDETAGSVESTIENRGGCAIENNGTLTLGKRDEKVNQTTPHIIGTPKAIENKGTFNWYDGKINDETTTEEKQDTQIAYVLSRRIMASAENILKIAEDTIQTAVQSPKIKLDTELPIWTQGPVTATIYTTDRIILDIINDIANVETRSLTVKKVWEMPDEEAQNYKTTIQLMKIVNGKKEPAKDRKGNIYTVEIIGNNSGTFKDIPAYRGSVKIEYALEEIKVQRKTAEGNWEDVPMTDFNVTYKQMTTD